MTFLTLILRSLRFRWRAHLGVVLGAAVGSAALIGALVVGDSVRESLRETALQRLGLATLALDAGDRLFTTNLSQGLEAALRGSGPATSQGTRPAFKGVSLMKLDATVSKPDGSARANQIQLFGVPKGSGLGVFSEAGSGQNRFEWNLNDPSGVYLNEALSMQLHAAKGDQLLIRVRKPSAFSREATLSPQSGGAVALRLRVQGVVPGAKLGDLSFRANQLPPLNAFVDLTMLADKLGCPGKANVILATSGILDDQLNQGLAQVWKLEDCELVLREITPGSSIELSTPRIFLAPAIERSARMASSNAQPILTYVANQFRLGTNTTPYSMVTAAGLPWVPPDMREDEILLNQWLADDLGAKPGDEIALTYFLPDSAARLAEATNRFRVRGVVPLLGIYDDRTLMPEFPGLAKAESTHDWDAGFPLVHKIREKDDVYWKQHRGTPKAFVSLAAGQKMWANRFGSLTAIRFPIASNAVAETRATLEKRILAGLKPADVGLRFEPVRAQALAAAGQSQDFGGLFIGFSFFLIAAALILMALLFQLGLEQRATETGTFLALGFRPGQVRRLLLWEGSALALVGGVTGALGGMVYARLMLHGLTTIWRQAVGTPSLAFHAAPLTLGIGLLAAVLVNVVTAWLVLRQQARKPARELLAGGDVPSATSKTRNLSVWIALAAWAMAAALVGWALWRGETSDAETFFSAGALCLIGGLACLSAWLARLDRLLHSTATLSLFSLAARGCTRRRKRSLAVAALLASGVFIIASIGVFRLDANQQAWKRSSGTGGFALIGQTTLPVIKDLNSAAGRDSVGLDETDLKDVSFVSMRVREGDDASCLNLNRAQTPRLLGVKPEFLAERGSFSFSQTEKNATVTNGWLLLKAPRLVVPPSGGQGDLSNNVPGHSEVERTTNARPPEGGTTNEVPAIGDAASIQWALGKKVGDTLDYTDEAGRSFKVRLVGAVANSILQGSLLIDEEAFLQRFPGEAGYRMFLIDAPSNRVRQVSEAISRGLQDVGMEVTPAVQRLEQLNAVQNTYLSTFLVLGGLGLLLGSAGLGVVVLRNMLERRGELALLLAVGFRRRRLRWLVLGEHIILLGAGLIVGIGSAWIAVLPALGQAAGGIPWRSLVLTLGGVVAVGLLATWAGTWLALRGPLLEALRNE